MNPAIKEHGVKIGLIYGSVSILYALYAYLIDSTVYTKMWTGIAFFFVAIGFYIYAVAKVKKEMGGYISFKEAFSAFMVAAIVATALSTVFNMLLMGVIDPAFAEEVFDNIKMVTYERLENANLPEEKMEEIMANFEGKNPFSLWSQTKTFFTGVAFSAIIGLITAAAMKKDNPEMA